MRADHDELVEMVAAAAGALWRARLELGLLALLVLSYVGLREVAGTTLAVIVVAAVVVTALLVPVSRARLVDALHAARVRRQWWRACTDVDVPVPRAGSVTRVLAGDQVQVRVALGSSVAAIEERSEELAACLRVRDLRVVRDRGDASCGQVTFVRRDPLAELAGERWPELDAERWSLWDPIPIGLDEDGGTVLMSLPERNVLLGGEPGAGKSAALSVVIAGAALDPEARLWLLDGKLELAAWRRVLSGSRELMWRMRSSCCGRFGPRWRRATAGCYAMAGGRCRVGTGSSCILSPSTSLRCVEDRKQRSEFAELLRDLVARGRAAGVIVVAATQKPGSDVVPTALRDLFGFRLALRCNTPQASDTILGQGWATLGYRASDIASADRGVGYLLAEGGTPVRLRSFFLCDDDVSELAARATAMRLQEAWSGAIAQESAAS